MCIKDNNSLGGFNQGHTTQDPPKPEPKTVPAAHHGAHNDIRRSSASHGFWAQAPGARAMAEREEQVGSLEEQLTDVGLSPRTSAAGSVAPPAMCLLGEERSARPCARGPCPSWRSKS